MTMFRWIVKLIRDEYDVENTVLTRGAVLETDRGLAIEQIETVTGIMSENFNPRFPSGTLDEILKPEESRMLASWMKGLYKCPPFLPEGFEASCRGMNPEYS